MYTHIHTNIMAILGMVLPQAHAGSYTQGQNNHLSWTQADNTD